MKNMRSFAIFQIQLTNVRSSLRRPFRIMETYMTLDGYRTRICDGNWETFDEANTFMGEILDKQGLQLEFYADYE